jgi:hypothetical protein
MNLFATFPNLSKPRCSLRLTLIIIPLLVLCSLVLAEGRIIHVARLSLIEGEVSYQRANDPQNNWFDATVNIPLGENDQVYTGRDGRAEIQLTGCNIVRLDHNTNLRITQFNTGTTQLTLAVGTATFRVDSLDRRQFQILDARDAEHDDPVYFEVDTPTAAITLLKEGVYRVNVDENGTTEVVVRSGEAEVYNQELGVITIKKGRRMVIEGEDPNLYQIARLKDKDNFDRWNDWRDDELLTIAEVRSTRYVPAGIAGIYDLDRYGDWWYTSDYGYVWSPRAVAVGWAPYRFGYWRWYPAFGWTWISYEPWGWAPYHYGRWAYYRNRWCWVPHGGFSIGFSWSWAPALVTFFGYGRGYRHGYRDGFVDGYRAGYRDAYYDWICWVPLAPGEYYYGHPTIVNNTAINTPVIQPRTLDSFRNTTAPGGVTGLEGRQFANPRVVVNNPTSAPAGVSTLRQLGLIPVRGDALKPKQAETPRIAPAVSEAASRIIAAPVVTRRVSTPTAPDGPVRTVEGDIPTMRGTAAAPGGEIYRTPTRRDLPARDSNTTGASGGVPARGGDTTYRSPSRVSPPALPPSERRYEIPAQRPGDRPVERPVPPRRESDENRNTERHSPPRPIYIPPRQSAPPQVEPAPRRIEPARPSESRPTEAPRRVEPPARPPIERRELPSRPSVERREPPARPEIRQSVPQQYPRPDPPARLIRPFPAHVEHPSSPLPSRLPLMRER